MPIYEYKCSECGKVYEKRQKFSDPPDTVCDYCQKVGAVSRITSAPALVFKGSGWYVNDYAKAGKGASGGKSENGSKSDKGSSQSESSGSSASDSGTKSSSDSSGANSSTSSGSDSASKPSDSGKSA